MIDRKHLGRRWGPYRYTVGLEEIRDFAVTIAGGVPGRAFAGAPPERPSPCFVDEDLARSFPSCGVVAPPTFAARFAIQPFAAACIDPTLEIGLENLLHGEQRFEFGAPVRPGDRLETVGELVEVERKGSLELFTVRTTTTNQNGTTVVIGTWVAVRRGS